MSRRSGRNDDAIGVNNGNLMEVLRDIQTKMEKQEVESLELKEQVTRLREHNEQLREDSCVWQRECERLRAELTALQNQRHSGNAALDHGDRDDRIGTNNSIRAWQQETRRLQDRINYLEQESARLRAQLSKSSTSACCCFQLCQLLFRGNKRNSANVDLIDNGVGSVNHSSNNHATNNAVRVH